tara:strand:+ start:307 stop:906 length:600 start_codon:yes stop_codon:yes gene_type:complete
MNIIVAACKNRGIGLNNKLPWKLKKEMNIFTKLTKGDETNAVIMGKNTWLSLPKALPKRANFVISKSVCERRKKNRGKIPIVYYDNYIFKESYEDLYKNGLINQYKNKWIIGGAQIYNSLIHHENTQAIYYTEIDEEYKCDTFFPEIPAHYDKIYETKDIYDNDTKFRIKLYRNNSFYQPFLNEALINNLKNTLGKKSK